MQTQDLDLSLLEKSNQITTQFNQTKLLFQSLMNRLEEALFAIETDIPKFETSITKLNELHTLLLKLEAKFLKL